MHPGPPSPALSISSIWLFLSCIFYNELVIVSAFLSSMSHSNKLIKPKEGLWEPLIYSPLVRSIDSNLDWQLAF